MTVETFSSRYSGADLLTTIENKQAQKDLDEVISKIEEILDRTSIVFTLSEYQSLERRVQALKEVPELNTIALESMFNMLYPFAINFGYIKPEAPQQKLEEVATSSYRKRNVCCVGAVVVGIAAVGVSSALLAMRLDSGY